MLSDKYKKLVDRLEEDYEWYNYFVVEYNKVFKDNFQKRMNWDELNNNEYIKIMSSVYPICDIEKFNKMNVIYYLLDNYYYKCDIFKIVRMYNIYINLSIDKIYILHKKYIGMRVFNYGFYHNHDEMKMLIHALRYSGAIHKICYYELSDYHIQVIDDFS